MLGFLFNKVAALKVCNFFKIDSNPDVSNGYCKIFKNGFFMQHLQWLLLTVLLRYSKVSCGACSLIMRLHVHLILKTFTKRCTNNSLLSRDKAISPLLELVGHVFFDFRICFGKTLIVFDFDEKLTQSVAQVTV